MDEIEQKVKKIIAEQLGIKEEDIKNESSLSLIHISEPTRPY